jgi:salicylate hydroxylase
MTADGHLRGRQIGVIGGGVAGLAVARALALRGARVTLFEQAPAIAEVGAGLQVSPNGLRVIDALGLGAALRSVALAGRAVVLRDFRKGAQVLRIDLSRDGAAGDYLFVHRARLIEVLEAGAREAGVSLRLGARIVGGALPADLTIGADGLHSGVRAALNGSAPPFFTGQVAWRALIAESSGAPPEAQVFMGPRRHLVSYPLAGGLRNIVAVEERRDWAEEGWHHKDAPDHLRRAFARFGGPVPGWLAQVDEVHLWGLFRHPVAARWQDGARAILGDAAHPTLPFLAQGANLALEDAWVLADCLDRMPQAMALAAYEAARRPRATRVIDAATANARNYHLANPLVRGAAHTVLRLGGALAPAQALRRFDWLYGHDVTAGQGRGT